MAATNVGVSKCINKVLMCTAEALAKNGKRQKNVRLLFDSGIQKSLIMRDDDD